MTENTKVLAAVLQMNSTEDVAANVASALALVEEAVLWGAELLVLPEKFHYLGGAKGAVAASEPLDGALMIPCLRQRPGTVSFSWRGVSGKRLRGTIVRTTPVSSLVRMASRMLYTARSTCLMWMSAATVTGRAMIAVRGARWLPPR